MTALQPNPTPMTELLILLGNRPKEGTGDVFHPPAREPASKQILQLALLATERAATNLGLSAYDFAASRKQRSAYYKIHLAIKDPDHPMAYSQLADYINKMRLTPNDLCGGPPAPWNTTPQGGTIYICVATVPAQKELGRRRRYPMTQVDDLRAILNVHPFINQMGGAVNADISIVDWKCSNYKETFAKLVNNERSVGIVVVGSEKVNRYASLVRNRINANVRRYEPTCQLDFRKQKVRMKVNGNDQATWPRTETADVGVLLLRRQWMKKSFMGHKDREVPFVFGLAAGLGPAGTIAAADALTHGHEVAEMFDSETERFQDAVIVDKISACDERDVPNWRWGCEDKQLCRTDN